MQVPLSHALMLERDRGGYGVGGEGKGNLRLAPRSPYCRVLEKQKTVLESEPVVSVRSGS